MAKRLIKSINIMSVSGDTQGIERIDSQIKALILSMVGTIPGSRGFGLEREFISRPPQEALNLLAIELEEKLEEYIPEVTVANVEGKVNEAHLWQIFDFVNHFSSSSLCILSVQ